MNTVQVMEDGALRLPPEIASRLNAQPGDRISAEVDEIGVLHLYPQTAKIDDVCGMLHPPNNAHVSVEQMDASLAEAFRRGEV
ncbi:MAG: hypothetical protein BWY09_00417 [Candidatus Hydrogenedentes bacterium ADurb.Bin179]|nr:MAG: hypothetical protein BWY09_00417 [Candidatus Hydrogenedentes bacterium ADurb.Bin179]